jgi:thiamine-phosphate pyrophosphorylase
MRATRLPRLHVITDTRGPIAVATSSRSGAGAGHPESALRRDPAAASFVTPDDPLGQAAGDRDAVVDAGRAGPVREAGTQIAAVRLDSLAASDRDFGARSAAPQRDPLVVIEAALAAGARLVQVRPEDHYTDRAAFDLATAITALCDQYGAMCLINDRVHLALAVNADGVHLGADDLPIDAARRILPAASIIGGTARDPETARAARRAGATYLGVGPVWGTTTKAGLPQPIGLEGLAAVCEAVDLPVIAIGGITAERAALCREAGAHGVAVVGAIAGAGDPERATAELLEAVGESPNSMLGRAGRSGSDGGANRRFATAIGGRRGGSGEGSGDGSAVDRAVEIDGDGDGDGRFATVVSARWSGEGSGTGEGTVAESATEIVAPQAAAERGMLSPDEAGTRTGPPDADLLRGVGEA